MKNNSSNVLGDKEDYFQVVSPEDVLEKTFPFHLMNCSLNVVYRFSFMTKEVDFGVATWISQNRAIEYVIFKSSRVVQL